MDISELRGVGPKTIEWLSIVGITSVAQLEEIGAVGAYRLLKDAFPQAVSLNALWGLQAALMEVDWRELRQGLKDQMLAELDD